MPLHFGSFSERVNRNEISVVILAGVLCLGRWLIPERSLEYIGLRAIWDTLFSVGLSLFFLLISMGLGVRVLSILRLEHFTFLEIALQGMSIGAGITALGVLAIGLLGILKPLPIILWLAVLLFIGTRGPLQTLGGKYNRLTRALYELSKLPILLKGIIFIIIGILGLAFFQTLTPPWDVDGLIYHLQVPRTWLDAGGIFPSTDFWEANYPMLIEMIYSIGLAFGSDSFAKVIHFLFTILLISGTFCASKRYFNSQQAWIAPAILVGIPILPLWASSSYSDMGWAVYEFFSLFNILIWQQTNQSRYLILGGIFSGFAIGSKYPALASLAILGAMILWYCRRQGVQKIIANASLFGISALLVGSIWYIKNWSWFQNPIYPLNFGNLFETEGADHLWMTYMWDGFGTGNRLTDYLLIPWNLFVHRDRFSTFAGNIEIPSPLFLLALLYPFTRKNRSLDPIAVFVLLRYVTWMVGVQQTRLLLPLFPWVSLLTGEVMINIIQKPNLKRFERVLLTGLIGGLLMTTLLYSILLFAKTRPLGVIFGFESKGQFLGRLVDDFTAMQFIQTNLAKESRVLMMWDGRGYYCDDRCLPDSDHTQWTSLVFAWPETSKVTWELRSLGVTHLMLSRSDADFILQHDPTGDHLKAIRYFLDEFQPACTKTVYQDEWTSIYHLICP